jgi:hypothetical protein
MISPETRAEIRRYFDAEHWKIGTIARELNVHPDAVRNAIESERFKSMQPFANRVARLRRIRPAAMVGGLTDPLRRDRRPAASTRGQ